MTRRQVWIRIGCALFVASLTGFLSAETVRSEKADSLCSYIKFDDVGTTFRRVLTCDLPTIDSLGWIMWHDAADPADTCYDYRSPYCHDAYNQSAPNPEAGCNDERDTIIGEYGSYQVRFRPFCNSFANSGGTDHFTWSEYNGGFQEGNPHTNGYWGIVTAGLKTGLEATRSAYNRGGIHLESGYRCPHGNSNVGGVQNSFHMEGRAADLFSNDHAWTETEFNLLKAAGDSTSPIESFNWNTYNDHHYHIAWNP